MSALIGPSDIEPLRRCGRLVAEILEQLSLLVAPGVTTAQLDRRAAVLLAAGGARSAPQKIYKFPGAICISVNEEAVHGIPGSRVIQPGDVVKLDVTAELAGWMTDAACTVVVEPCAPRAQALSQCAEAALRQGLLLAREGRAVCDIGQAVEATVKQAGFCVLRRLCGHGIGRELHQAPVVPNFYDRRYRDKLQAGMVITIEPIISLSSEEIKTADDGWTICTKDGSLAAHFEHTLLITRDEPVILTCP